MITALALGSSVDVTYVVHALRLGSINRPLSVHRVPGGKGLNAARAAHLLGADVAAVAVLGASTGAWITEELDRIRLPLHAVPADAPTRTCVSIADGGHTMTELYEPAAPISNAEWAALKALLASTLAQRPGWLTISGSVPSGAPGGAIGQLVEIARRAHRRVAVDLHGHALADALETKPDLIRVNAGEAAGVVGAAADAPPARLAELLAEHAVAGTVVTAGVGGAHGFSHTQGSRAVRSAHRGAYPVGSGDCMLASLVSGSDRGQDLLDALVDATAVATANALAPGAACFNLADVHTVRTEIEFS